MMKETTPLYKKVGRKYIPVAAQWYEDAGKDQMDAGTFRLSYAYKDGGRRYEYQVTPATAPMVAAMMIAKVAMEEKLRDMSRMHPMGTITPYTKKQLALIERFKADMGGFYPTHWTSQSAYDIADAAVKAVMEFKA